MLGTDERGFSTFKAWLASAMEQRKPGMKQRELAEFAKLSPSVVNALVRNPDYRPTGKTIRTLADYFGADFNALWRLAWCRPPGESIDYIDAAPGHDGWVKEAEGSWGEMGRIWGELPPDGKDDVLAYARATLDHHRRKRQAS